MGAVATSELQSEIWLTDHLPLSTEIAFLNSCFAFFN
jgi:hypothetical protein